MRTHYKIEPDIGSYYVVQREGLLAMCDFIGFSNFIMNTDFSEHSNFVVTVLGILRSYEKETFNLILKENPSLREKLGEEWVDKFQLKTVLVSDTFIIYPELKCESLVQFEVTLQVISILISMLYRYILEEWGVFLRGVITYGEYGTIAEYPLIYGKGLIEAYYFEKMQDWSGIILIPSICKVIEKSLLLKYDYIPYKDLPLKNNEYAKEYLSECEKASMDPYVLNWVKYTVSDEQIINEEFWSKVIQKIKNTLQRSEKKAASDKIINTKKFYDYVRNQE